jgi:chromosome partitioning protein
MRLRLFVIIMAITICLAQSKGGTSKTSSVLNISACLIQQGYKVLAIDIDMQANLTSGLGVDPTKLERSMYALMTDQATTAADILVHTQEEVDLLPANLDLSIVELAIKEIMGREKILARKIRPLLPDYDFVLIDTPPSFALTTLNALTAADYLLSPVQPEPFCLTGMGNLVRTYDLVRENSNPNLEILGIFITMYDSRLSAHREIAEIIRQDWGDRAFEAVIRRRSNIMDSTAEGRSIIKSRPSSDLAQDYQLLTKEILRRVQKQ